MKHIRILIGWIMVSFAISGIIHENEIFQLWALQENTVIDSIPDNPIQTKNFDSDSLKLLNQETEKIDADTSETDFKSSDLERDSSADTVLTNLKTEIMFSSETVDTIAEPKIEININTFNYKFPGKAMLMSGVLPGLGELYSGSPLKAILFAGIEAGAWMYWSSMQEKIESKEVEYKTFADENWDFKRWVENYYAWENYENQYSESGLYVGDTVYIDGINIRRLFSEQIGENEYDYMHINEGSHTIYFYDPRYNKYVTFPDMPFGLSGDYFYCSDYNIIDGEFLCKSWTLNPGFQGHLNEGHILVQKNLHFYENIGKYNHFFMGWEDAQLVEIDSLHLENGSGYIGKDITYWRVGSLYFDPTFNQENFIYDESSGEIIDTSSTTGGQLTAVKVIYTKASIFNNDGYLVAKSPDKWNYRNLRDEYNKLGKVAGYAISAVMFNHVVSMIDAVISTNKYNRQHSNRITAEPIFDSNAKYGVSGIKLSFRF